MRPGAMNRCRWAWQLPFLLPLMIIVPGCEPGPIATMLGVGVDFAFSVGVSLDGTGTGSVTQSVPNGVYPGRSDVAASATCDLGTRFVGWYNAESGGTLVSGDASYVASLRSDTVLYARFDTLRILFMSDRDGTIGNSSSREIYAINADGSGITRLTDNSYEDKDPDWSADYSQISHSYRLGGDPFQIFTASPDGSSVSQITFQSSDSHCYQQEWSPDGSQFAYTRHVGGGYNQVYLIGAGGGGDQNISNNGNDEAMATWSPDGTMIAFMSCPNLTKVFTIWRMEPDGSHRIQLTSGYDDRNPVWSPDGAKIAFDSDRGDGDREIYVMAVDGSNLTPLTNNTASDAQPNWSPDSRQIVFQSDRDGDTEIYMMWADGTDPTPVTDNPANDLRPCW